MNKKLIINGVNFTIKSKKIDLTDELCNRVIKEFSTKPIFFNDIDCRHWVFDFKLTNTELWVECIEITNDFKNVVLNVYQ
jgi:hypothetical protein